MRRRVLVLCTGNSCRSIMGAAIFNHVGKGLVHAVSAGSKPVGYVHPLAIETLEAYGVTPVDRGDQRSKSWDEMANERFDLVVTVCDDAAREACPVFLNAVQKIHWGMPDPAKVLGTQEEIKTAFHQTFHRLKEKIEEFLA